MTEIWKDIKGYEEHYQISNKGRVKSLARRFIDCRGRNQNIKERIMKVGKDTDGYPIVALYKNNKAKTQTVHRLVAKHFLKRIEGKNTINHKNFIRDDNIFTNLEWCTTKENILFSAKEGRYSKLTNKQILEIYNRIKNGERQPKIAKEYCVDSRTIRAIIRGETHKHLKFKPIKKDFTEKGEKSHSAKLKKETVLEIHKMVKLGVTRLIISDKYNISEGAIQHIIKGRNWKHLNLEKL